jgi:Predicted GTPase
MQEQQHKTKAIQKDTIYALSSTPGRSALSVIRITGETAFLIIEKLTKNRIKKIKHQTSIPSFIYNKNNDLIDKVVLAFHCAPNSYTGEDLVEITTHGNPIIVDNLFNALKDLGLRLANPR